MPDPAPSTEPLTSPSDNKALPVLRGQVLRLAALAVSSSPLIASIVYRSAGFARVRGLAKTLEPFEACYNPAVIPASNPAGAVPQSEAEFVQAWLAAPQNAAKSRYVSVRDYHEAYRAGRTTPVRVAKELVALVSAEGGKPKEGHAVAFTQVEAARVLAAAEAATARYQRGEPLGPLDGVPIAIKDQVDVEGYALTMGSTRNFIKGGRATQTAWCVQQWVDAGAVVIGLTNMHELGMDTTNNNPHHGTPRNPHNAQYYTGGSSGGSAYAVSSGLVPFALGADGGGSIRLPSSFCGLYGLKTSHDRVSGAPTRNYCVSTGVYGPLAASVADLHLAYRVLARPDPGDAHARLYPGFTAGPPPGQAKVIGVYRAWINRADAAVRAACEAAIAYLQDRHGYTVKEIEMPHLSVGQSAHALTILSEAATAVSDISDLSPANQILLSICKQGTLVDVMLNQKLRTALMEHLKQLWAETPGMLIATPTCPTAGWPIKSPADLVHGSSDSTMSLRSMEYVWLANFTGVPALSAPVGYADPVQGQGQIPVGMLLMGEWGAEEGLIAAGYLLEEYLGDKRKLPGVFVDPLELASRGEAKAE